jgi:hypothetical protein
MILILKNDLFALKSNKKSQNWGGGNEIKIKIR